MRLPPLNSLRAFDAAARHLSFTKAAAELFVTQAAISQQIKTLEQHLAVKLFHKQGRSLALTDAGLQLSAEVKTAFLILEQATQRIAKLNEPSVLTVCAPPSFAIKWLIPRLSDFSVQHPDIDVRIKADNQDEGTMTADVDVAVYYGKGPWPGLLCELLHADYLLPVCTPTYARQKCLSTPQDLQKCVLLHDANRDDWRLWAKDHLPSLAANTGPIFSHSAMVIQAAELGQGVALAHSALVKPELESGRLISPLPQALHKDNAYYLVSWLAQAQNEKIQRFRAWMAQMVKE